MEIIKRLSIGISISCVITVVSKLIFHVETITPTEIGFNFFVAMVASILSFLDHIEQLGYWQITLCHFLGSYLLISVGYFYLYPFTVVNLLSFTLNTVIIYVIVWSAFVLKNFIIAKTLNQQLNSEKTNRNFKA
ncbi:DUF3021 family protein [Vagococcus carniphilus]|uniref:DUF3021 family protein n=1 Tax=Vagococcus carniphilus TaxID=218144 RepID=UPI003BAC3F47